MGLLDNLKTQIGNQLGSQFIEIIQWLDDSYDAMVYRFPVYNQEIKMGAQLTVRENQAALFINEGKAADLFGPGRYELTTQNLPILTTLRGWKYGFQSPFKAEVYFFNTRLFTDLKWGTTNPVMMRDAEFGMIRLRAFGTYAMKVADPKTFFATIVGTQGLTTTDEITGQLRSTILSKLSDAIAEAKVAALDIASKYDELSTTGKQILAPEFAGYGLDLSKFFIENVSAARGGRGRDRPAHEAGRPRRQDGAVHAAAGRRRDEDRRREPRRRRGRGRRDRRRHRDGRDDGRRARERGPGDGRRHGAASPAAGSGLRRAALVAHRGRQDVRAVLRRRREGDDRLRPGGSRHPRLEAWSRGLGPALDVRGARGRGRVRPGAAASSAVGPLTATAA